MNCILVQITKGLTVLAAGMIMACGGNGSSTPATGTATISTGVVEKLGSVTVNGVTFKVSGAKLQLRDDAANQVAGGRVLQNETELQDNNLLKVGMVVAVKGRIDNNGVDGAATEIEFRDTLKGRIDNLVDDRLTVMGQTILVDDRIKGLLAGPNALKVNDDIQISGIVDDKGQIRASHIEKQNALAEFEAKGFINNLNGNTFTLVVDQGQSSGIAVTINGSTTLPVSGIKNGDFVEVSAAGSSANLTATKIALEDTLKRGADDQFEVEGYIAVIGGSGFTLRGYTVITNSATVYRGGVAADLLAGMKVEVEGVLDASNNLIAKKVTFKESLRLNGNAASVDTTAKNLSLLGKTIIYNNGTEFSGFTDPATLTGKNVEVRGNLSADGLAIIAAKIDLKGNAAADAFIRGPVASANLAVRQLNIIGILVTTDDAITKYKDQESTPDPGISAAAFFSGIVPNVTVVKVRWNPFSSLTAAPKEVQYEN